MPAKQYLVKPTDGSRAYTVKADKVEVSETSGAVTFSNDDGTIVSRVFNVSFRDTTPESE